MVGGDTDTGLTTTFLLVLLFTESVTVAVLTKVNVVVLRSRISTKKNPRPRIEEFLLRQIDSQNPGEARRNLEVKLNKIKRT